MKEIESLFDIEIIIYFDTNDNNNDKPKYICDADGNVFIFESIVQSIARHIGKILKHSFLTIKIESEYTLAEIESFCIV